MGSAGLGCWAQLGLAEFGWARLGLVGPGSVGPGSVGLDWTGLGSVDLAWDRDFSPTANLIPVAPYVHYGFNVCITGILLHS